MSAWLKSRRKLTIDNRTFVWQAYLMIQALQLEPEQKLDWLIRRRHEIDVQELEWSVVAADFSATDESDRLGYVSAIDCLRISCHMTGPAVADRVEVGDRIGDLCDSTDA